MDQKALRRAADLTIVGHAPAHRLIDRKRDVRVIEHNKGIVAAKLQRNMRQMFRACLRRLYTNSRGTGERDTVHILVTA